MTILCWMCGKTYKLFCDKIKNDNIKENGGEPLMIEKVLENKLN